MDEQRFLLILCCLHFAKNIENNQEYHLYKTRPVINYFNKNMSDIYYPDIYYQVTGS